MQFVELRLKLVADLNNPAQDYNMTYRTYDVKYMYGLNRENVAWQCGKVPGAFYDVCSFRKVAKQRSAVSSGG